jgi:hypothetical protein
MTAAMLIAEFHQRGIRLIPEPPKLAVEPASKLTGIDRERIRKHKADLLALLSAEHKKAEINRIGRLDTERREADRQAGRGYDFDSTAPSHIGFMMASNPAYSIIADCRRYGVALRIDPDGSLVVGKAGAKAEEPTQPWPSLLVAIEANLETVAELVAAGWTLGAEFPQRGTA